MEKYVNQLEMFIADSKDFEFLNISNHGNMGANIIDAILQAGLNYNSVVKPRVENFKNKFGNLKTTSDFYTLIQKINLSELLNFKGAKIERIRTLAKLLKEEKVETEEDLKEWLSHSDNTLILSNLKGIKSKTIDYLKILSGNTETVAIDSRLVNFIKICCKQLDQVSYEFAHALLMKTAAKLNVKPAILDFSIWSYMEKRKAIT